MPHSRYIGLGVIGCFLSPAVALSMIALAISRADWFSWTGNALSDLGMGETATVFNSGLIVGGALAAAGALGLFAVLSGDLVGRVGAGLFFLSSVFLVMIGIFTEGAGRIHYWVSVAFFASLPISMLVIAAAMILSGQPAARAHGALTIVLAVVAAAGWALPHDGVAIPEIISSVVSSAWLISMGLRMLGSAIGARPHAEKSSP